MSRLENHVKKWEREQRAEGYETAWKDLLENGCVSGMVGHLIYYRDTVKFYQRHRQEIDGLLKESLDSCGVSGPGELFGEKWDREDPLARGDLNQNLLAWFGFEETVRGLHPDY